MICSKMFKQMFTNRIDHSCFPCKCFDRNRVLENMKRNNAATTLPDIINLVQFGTFLRYCNLEVQQKHGLILDRKELPANVLLAILLCPSFYNVLHPPGALMVVIFFLCQRKRLRLQILQENMCLGRQSLRGLKVMKDYHIFLKYALDKQK